MPPLVKALTQNLPFPFVSTRHLLACLLACCCCRCCHNRESKAAELQAAEEEAAAAAGQGGSSGSQGAGADGDKVQQLKATLLALKTEQVCVVCGRLGMFLCGGASTTATHPRPPLSCTHILQVFTPNNNAASPPSPRPALSLSTSGPVAQGL